MDLSLCMGWVWPVKNQSKLLCEPTQSSETRFRNRTHIWTVTDDLPHHCPVKRYRCKTNTKESSVFKILQYGNVQHVSGQIDQNKWDFPSKTCHLWYIIYDPTSSCCKESILYLLNASNCNRLKDFLWILFTERTERIEFKSVTAIHEGKGWRNKQKCHSITSSVTSYLKAHLSFPQRGAVNTMNVLLARRELTAVGLLLYGVLGLLSVFWIKLNIMSWNMVFLILPLVTPMTWVELLLDCTILRLESPCL